MAVAVLFVMAAAKYMWVLAGATIKWQEQVSSINPLDTEFTKQRIKIQDLAHPINKEIRNKKFTDCELIGPANVLFQDAVVHDPAFRDCEVVVFREGIQMHSNNLIVFIQPNITRGTISNCTIYISPNLVTTFTQMGANIIT